MLSSAPGASCRSLKRGYSSPTGRGATVTVAVGVEVRSSPRPLHSNLEGENVKDGASLIPDKYNRVVDKLHAERALADTLANALRDQYVHNCERGDSVASVLPALAQYDASRGAK
jgi:hypothetical protein